MRGAPILLDRLAPEDAEHFERVKALLDDAGITYELDPTLVRGLDYYARTLWEFTSDALGAQSAVGGGGRYDGLIEQLGGPPTPGVGWAAGVERMLLAAGEQPSAPALVHLFVAIAPHGPDGAQQVAFRLANDARRAGLSAQMELAGRGLMGQLKHADRHGARYVAIIDDQMRINLKDMEAGGQTEVQPAEVIPTILRGSRVA
jgi:histidyl-tRNA synthetase